VEAGITNTDVESNCSESSNWDFETFVSTDLQNLESSTEQTLSQPSVEEQNSAFDDHSINLGSPVDSPVPIMSQEDIMDQSHVEDQEFEWPNSSCLEDDLPVQSYVEEQELECSNSLCLADVVHSPVHPPYSPLPITFQEESDCVNTTNGFKLVGDNVDKDVKPRHICINHQTKSLNYFNALAIQDRTPTFHLPEDHTSTPSLGN